MNDEISTNCPKCHAPVPSGSLDCTQCGILFSKWQEREENVAMGNTGRYTIAHATSSEFNWVILAILCVVIVAIFFFIENSSK